MSDVLASHYMAGVIGLALLRHWYEPGADNEQRLSELRGILDQLDEFPQNLILNPTEQSVADGYRDWSAIYDGPNPMIELEESVTVPWLQTIIGELGQDQRALDAGCGTGRQAKLLSDLGAAVTGIDATQEMLDIAAEKVPDGEFRQAMLDALPFDDDSFDLAIASLAICHLDEPAPALAELARCVRPGGSILISEPHPMVAALGGQAFYGGFRDDGMTFVRNNHHQLSAWVNACAGSDLEIVECVELGYDADVLKSNPLMPVVGEALTAGFTNLPFILCLRLRVA